MPRRRSRSFSPFVSAALGLAVHAASGAAAAAAEKVDTWLDVSPPVRAGDLRVVYPDPFRPGVVWLGGVGGVLYSDDAGASWVESLRVAARSRTIGGPGAGTAGSAEEGAPLDRDSDADDPDADDVSPGADDGDDAAAALDGRSREDVLAEATEAAIEELADEFGVEREDVEVVLADELESLLEERFGDLLTGDLDDDPGAETGTVRLDAIDSIASSAAAPAVIWAAGSAGIYLSRDDGTSWEARAVPGGRSVTAIAVDPGDADHVLAATVGGLWQSFDGAVTWSETGPPELKGRAVAGVAWDLDEPDRAAAWTRSVLALTKDGAEGWTAREISAASGAGRIRGFAFVGAPLGRIAIAGEDAGFVSDDDGESWWPLPDLPETPLGVAARPGTDFIWAAGTSRVYRVDGGGVAPAWEEIAEGWVTSRVRSLAADPRADGEAWVVTGAGVFRRTRATLGELAEAERRMLAARFDEDPSLEATLAAALRHARIDATRMLGLAKRARLAGALPRVRLYASWRVEEDRSIDGIPSTARGITTDDDWRLLVMASWDLSALGFDRREASVAGLLGPAAKAREELVDRVLTAYSHRRAAAIALVRAPERDLGARLTAELKYVELGSELDALTGGWFTKHLVRKDAVIGKKSKKG